MGWTPSRGSVCVFRLTSVHRPPRRYHRIADRCLSAFHPGKINGKVMSSVRQQVALWPDLPQEKHFISDQSRCAGRCLNSWLGIRLLSRKLCNLVSNLVGSYVVGKAGFLSKNFPSGGVLANIDGSGVFIVILAPGLSISTNFLSRSLESSTNRSGLFTVIARTVSGSFSGGLTT